MARQTENNPKFFKVFDATKYSSQLHIPSAFISHMKGNLPKRAVLRDRYGNMWAIQLARIESEWYFGEGWAKVAQDNSLEHHDIVIFQFHGDRIFDFKIVGRGSSEKKGVGSLKYHLKDKEMEEDHREEEKEDDDDDDDDDYDDDDDDDDEYTVSGRVAKKYSIAKKDSYADLYGSKLIKSGRLIQPKIPYFIGKIRPNRRKELYIPFDVVKDFKFTLPEKILLRDSAGRSWRSKLTIWKDGRTFYTGGWDGLCRVNLIKKEDKCLCEFLLGKGKPILHIQRIPKQDVPET